MDPDKTLADLHANVQEALSEVYAAGPLNAATLHGMLIDIAEGFDNLDTWLRKGGFLPTEWKSKTLGAVRYWEDVNG